ncbi:RNA 2',3'-cyclic phosphodiesterase [Streptomyces alfalfae]|uniref:RNA 2',3'-cyclic phosphodiesterase n=1 Tax=Streptomyces alfalfae TaxID=1642299 RepID=A0A7T4PCL4_9ACTN|nr:RNA 2',3'-cyclic phosphodiesterase [Streptomyces alfalfae]QQC87667.1 RNA 2',3'-cyclic phosphodiesterase [Streptomyces alfalfae]
MRYEVLVNEETPLPTARVFIALAPPDEAKRELVGELGSAYAAHPRMRWNRVEDWHITLAFLGEVPADVIPLLRSPLADLATARPPLTLALRGGGHFDERVLWAGVAGELDALHELAADVRATVTGCGIALPDRRFRPHLTLARARRDTPSCAPRAATGLAGFAGRPWQTERLHLVAGEVVRGPGPIRYGDVAAWAFGGVREVAGE